MSVKVLKLDAVAIRKARDASRARGKEVVYIGEERRPLHVEPDTAIFIPSGWFTGLRTQEWGD